MLTYNQIATIIVCQLNFSTKQENIISYIDFNQNINYTFCTYYLKEARNIFYENRKNKRNPNPLYTQ